jgi:hypothetical protein
VIIMKQGRHPRREYICDAEEARTNYPQEVSE